MFGFHKPKLYRSLDGCCICRAKSSSSRFTDSSRYESHFKNCFGLGEFRCGDICNACVLLVKRWRKLPAGSKKNWNHVVDAKGGSNVKATLRTKKMKKQREVLWLKNKKNNSDGHSSTSPAQSPSYSNPSDEGSDTELSLGPAPSHAFSFLDLTYWKRERVCCGVVYRGRYGEVLIHPHLYKPCCQRRRPPVEQQGLEEPGQEAETGCQAARTKEGEEEEEEQEEQEEQEEEEEEKKNEGKLCEAAR
ncbi:SIN3-HDAC complex-associated factor-like [Nelusetta ayraudi]|uniref:SIN3-HDAC complex-associated factor-like n=1 Tax=Nelusetta ayraudi TaxID=303726 RepID=UPI003F712ED6